MMAFLLRYNFLLYVILLLVGVVWSLFFFTSLSILPIVLAVFVLGMRMILTREYEWACKKCGYGHHRAEKYCVECGGLTKFRKITHPYKICENGHRIEEENHRCKFCPKCGKPLTEEVIPEMGKELSNKVS